MLQFLRSRLGTPAILLITATLGAGCGPRCERVCDKLLECGDVGALETDRFSHDECEQSCQRQGDVFTGWEDEQEFQEAWDEHRKCLIDAECAEIADGVCYDDRFFVIGP